MMTSQKATIERELLAAVIVGNDQPLAKAVIAQVEEKDFVGAGNWAVVQAIRTAMSQNVTLDSQACTKSFLDRFVLKADWEEMGQWVGAIFSTGGGSVQNIPYYFRKIREERVRRGVAYIARWMRDHSKDDDIEAAIDTAGKWLIALKELQRELK